MYKRIILKLSGETLAPETIPADKSASLTFDAARVTAAAEMIIKLADLGVQVGIVMGGGNIWRGRFTSEMNPVQADQMGMLATIINALADVPSALFGGPPIEAIISGTAGAPWPVACGVVFMLVTGILILTGLISRLGKYLPAQSISGFLFVIGLFLTFAPNLSSVAASEGSMSGYIALGVTAWSKNPFLGMVAGILVKFFGAYVGL